MAEKGRGDSQEEQAAAGGTMVTDLQGAFRVVSRTPKDRLLSITFKMSSCDPAEQLVQTMALIVLNREVDALQQLQALREHHIAAYLAGQVRESCGQLEDIKVDSFQLPEPRVGTLRELARIFRVLVQERLCEASLCDQAYEAVLLECKNNSNGEEMQHTGSSYLNELIEEVVQACGMETSSKALQLRSDSLRSLSAGLRDENSHSYPTSLLSSTYSSYPSHLEISATPTRPAGGSSPTNTQSSQQASTHTQDSQQVSTHTQDSQQAFTHTQNLHSGASSAAAALVEGATQGHPDRVSRHSAAADKHRGVASAPVPAAPVEPGRPPVQCSGRDGTRQLVTSISTGMETLRLSEPVLPAFSRSVSAPETPAACEDERAVFYSFVILHSPEDAEEAEELRENLECVTSGTGATFSQDFAIPGRPTLSCLDDAIDNSAFTILLLSRNFTSRMQEVLTDSALINSIHNTHKYNSVIPLLPLNNPLPQDSLPRVLRTIVSLKEGSRSFRQNAMKAISPQKVARQRVKWEREQEAKRLQERRQRLLEENCWREQQMQQAELNQRLLRQAWDLHWRQQNMPSPTPAPPFHPPTPGTGVPPSAPLPNYSPHTPQMNPDSFWGHPSQAQAMPYPPNSTIHISNAQCIMIGNNSTMTIGDPEVLYGDQDED